MNTLIWLKLFHLIGMLMWFGTLMLMHGTISRNLVASDSTVRRTFAEAIQKLNFRYLLPGLLISVVTGLWMIFGFFGMAAPYLHAKLTFGLLGAVATLLALAFFRPILASAEREGPDSTAYRSHYRRWKITNMVATTLLLLTLISAVVKF